MLKSERNFQIEVFALLINLFLIVFLKLNTVDAAIILIVSFAVLSLEILNTACLLYTSSLTLKEIRELKLF